MRRANATALSSMALSILRGRVARNTLRRTAFELSCSEVTLRRALRGELLSPLTVRALEASAG